MTVIFRRKGQLTSSLFALSSILSCMLISTPTRADIPLVSLNRNDLQCKDLYALGQNAEENHKKQTLSDRLFQDYKSGESIELKIPAEEILDIKLLSGK